MTLGKSTFFIVMLALTVLLTAAGLGSSSRFKNLKILPKDISEQKLDSIMHSYNKALQVSCDFCHVKSADTLNFADDNNHMKESARKMMLLTIDINKNYFNYDSTIHPVYLNAVTCNTCHRGNPFPWGE